MRRPALLWCLAAATFACLLAACGGSSNNTTTNRNITALHDPKAAPTASAPAVLPTPLIAGSLPAAAAGGAAAGGAAGDTYVVAAGDTLGAIADKFSISVADIEAFNPGVDPARLQIGQSLKIPKPGQTPGPSSTATPGVSGAALSTPGPQPTAANGPVTIPPTGGAPNGNSSPIPSLNASATTAAGLPTAAAGSATAGAGEYIVQSGDSACKIATNAKITVQELAAANNLTAAALTRLTIGQVLKIPASTGHIGCT